MPKKNNLDSIAEHIKILNKEVGLLQIDIAKLKTSVKWTTRIISYMAVLLTTIAGKIIFFA